MIAGGDNRSRWAHEDGDKALEAIHEQRAITEIVKHHRANPCMSARSSRSKTVKFSTRALPAVPEDPPLEEEEPLLPRSREASAVAKLAAAEAVKCGYTRGQYNSRRRQFRKVRLRSGVRCPVVPVSIDKLRIFRTILGLA